MRERHEIKCPSCGTQMVFMKKLVLNNGSLHGWYVCPRRKNKKEDGCGHICAVKFVPNPNGKDEYVHETLLHK